MFVRRGSFSLLSSMTWMTLSRLAPQRTPVKLVLWSKRGRSGSGRRRLVGCGSRLRKTFRRRGDDAIAACVIRGASLIGGRGTIFGACLGALIMAGLDNGMSLLNVRDFMQDSHQGLDPCRGGGIGYDRP